MPARKISELHWNMILEGIHEGTCVPFLGAAVNVSSAARGYKGLPLGPEVALRLIELLTGSPVRNAQDLAVVTGIRRDVKNAGLDEDLARLGFQNLPRVALHVEVQSLNKRAYLLGHLRAILSDAQCEPSKLLHLLAAMPMRLIVTTNFDRLLERALDRAIEGSLGVTPDDLADASVLAAALRNPAEPFSAYLRAQLPATTRQLLDGPDVGMPPSPALRTALAQAMDQVVRGPRLWQPPLLVELPFSDEVRGLAELPDAQRLNRRLLETAYPGAILPSRKPYRLVVQPVDGFRGEEQAEHLTNPPPEDVLVVYKIHGTFDDGVPPAPGERRPGVVITEEDYITFLTVIATPGAGVPAYVISQFIGGSLLFLGYSLEDWDFRTLYKGLIEPLLPDERRTSFAIQWRPPKFWAHYWEQKGVVIYDQDIHAFAECGFSEICRGFSPNSGAPGGSYAASAVVSCVRSSLWLRVR